MLDHYYTITINITISTDAVGTHALRHGWPQSRNGTPGLGYGRVIEEKWKRDAFSRPKGKATKKNGHMILTLFSYDVHIIFIISVTVRAGSCPVYELPIANLSRPAPMCNDILFTHGHPPLFKISFNSSF